MQRFVGSTRRRGFTLMELLVVLAILVLLMAAAAGLGSFMSSTGVVAIFIPIVLRIAAQTNLNASRMLMPMSYAALISGMLTLIATTPNLVVHEELKSEGYAGFGFFGFSAIGITILAIAIAFTIAIGSSALAASSLVLRVVGLVAVGPGGFLELLHRS